MNTDREQTQRNFKCLIKYFDPPESVFIRAVIYVAIQKFIAFLGVPFLCLRYSNISI